MSVAISHLRVLVDEESLIARKPRVTIEGLYLSVSEDAMSVVKLANGKVQIERLTGGVIRFSTSLTPIGAMGELRPSVGPNGAIRLELVSLRAAGLVPLPKSVVLHFAQREVTTRGIRGVTFPGESVIEIDPNEVLAFALAQQAPGVEVKLAPLQALRAGEGVLELQI